MFNGTILNAFKSSILVVIVLTMTQCVGKTTSELPKDILGISIGMSKENADRRLREIGKFIREEGKRQQVWMLNDNPNLGHIAIGYSENNQVRYVTAFAKPRDGQPLPYKNVGDLSAAKEEIAGPNRRYIWQVPAQGDTPGYSVIARGGNAEFLSSYTLSKSNVSGEKSEEELEEEREER